MRLHNLLTLLAVGAATSVCAGEPKNIDGATLIANFSSLATADHAAGSQAITNSGATLAPGKCGQGLSVAPGQHVEIASKSNFPAERGTLMFLFRPNWSTDDGSGSHALLS